MLQIDPKHEYHRNIDLEFLANTILRMTLEQRFKIFYLRYSIRCCLHLLSLKPLAAAKKALS